MEILKEFRSKYYNTGLSFEEIAEIAKNRVKMLDDIDRLNFLNERGKIQLRFEEEIDYACGFSRSKEELFDNMRDDISKINMDIQDEIMLRAIDKMKTFIKYFEED